jgi:hypothetical protein
MACNGRAGRRRLSGFFELLQKVEAKDKDETAVSDLIQ